jgi:cysteinyl-tRNA synthetase
MALKIYNSLTRQKEEFKPLIENNVGIYTCGPTVYNYAHIGNYRAYIFSDILRRYFDYCGYKVNHIMNITDVDDKTIRESQKENKSLKEFTEFYTEALFKDRDSLNITRADTYTKATEYIPQMIKIIETLLEKDYAYKTPDGSVYFNIHKDKEYGKLSHFNLSDLKENADGRLKKDEYEKENAQDFALWKAYDESDGDVFWNTPFGKGRPGWHIECSAMSMSKLGETFDIHTGGIDLIFPHHENEIAQSESSTGHHFVNYWMHNEHLLVDGKKMSKSLGNFYILNDLVEKNINPIAFRYWLYMGHYRTQVNFTIDGVTSAQTALNRLYGSYKNLGEQTGIVDKDYVSKLKNAMDDDLNTSISLSLIWELIKDTNVSNEDKKATLLDFDKVFGFGLDKIKTDIIPEEIKKLAEEREKARLDKDWSKSDELRDQIKNLGYEIKDTENGTEISKI